jgi:hypothetical protein
LTWKRIVLSRAAQQILNSTDDEHRDRFWRIVKVIKQAPEDGGFYMKAHDGAVIRQMTGIDTHVQYTVRMWPVGRVLQIVWIEIRDWTPWWIH